MRDNRDQAAVLVENENVKVSEWRFCSGAAAGCRRHEYDYVVVPLHTGSLTMLTATGDQSETSLPVEASYYRDAGVERASPG